MTLLLALFFLGGGGAESFVAFRYKVIVILLIEVRFLYINYTYLVNS